jgi:hypothetical protein
MSGDTSPEAFQRVLDDVAGGMSLEAACKGKNRPHKATVLRKTRDDATFCAAYAEALECRSETRIEKIHQTCERLEAQTIDPGSARELINTWRWLAAKDSARFSDKIKSEISGPNGAPLIPERAPPDELEVARFIAHMAYQAGMRRTDDPIELMPHRPLLGSS